MSDSIQDHYPEVDGYPHTNILLNTIAPYILLEVLFRIVEIHKIQVSSHVPKPKVVILFDQHTCDSCNLYITVFKAAASGTTKTVIKRKCANNRMQRMTIGPTLTLLMKLQLTTSIVDMSNLQYTKRGTINLCW